MSGPAESYESLQSDIAALLTDSAPLAAWDAAWASTEKVFEGIGEVLRGQRNLGRMPFVEVGAPVAEHEEVSTADYGGLLTLRLRCRLARDWSEGGNGERAGEMFHRIWQTLESAMQSGTIGCPGLRNGRIAIDGSPALTAGGRALSFDIVLRWTAPLAR